MTQPMPGKPAEDAENELDIRGLFRTLWAGKLWIIGMGLAFALIALAYTFFARQEWSSTAITDRPTVNMLGGYYSQQQYLQRGRTECKFEGDLQLCRDGCNGRKRKGHNSGGDSGGGPGGCDLYLHL